MNTDFLREPRYRFAELARVVNKHIATIVRWTQRGVRGHVLKSYRLGGQYYIDREAIIEFLQAINGGGLPPTNEVQAREEEKRRRVDEALDKAGI
jgi:hypothetical protein